MSEHDKVEAACRDADIVVNTAPDISHDEDIKAILRGLAGRAKKPFYIHNSGASLIWDEPEGNKDAHLWDDIVDVEKLITLNVGHTHAATDRIVRAAAPDVNISIVSPGFVGGLSPSIEHPTPITTPAILTTARAFGSGFQISQGENISAWIHVSDLANMFMVLIDDALAVMSGTKVERTEPLALWGPEAYYFGVAENIRFADLMKALSPVLHQQGVIGSTEIKSVSVTEAAQISLAGPGKEYDPLAPTPPADSWAIHISIMYGINMRLRASRMSRLGWKPEMPSLLDTFSVVFSEYLRTEKQAL